MHSSGIHATIAGVLLGLVVPAVRVHGIERLVRPISAGVALPVFALFAAGVTIIDTGGVGDVLAQPVVLAVGAGLVLGKFIGVWGTTALLTGLTRLHLPDAVGMRDLVPVGLLAGIGFTVSLLIAGLSFGSSALVDAAKIGVLLGTLVAAVLAAISLTRHSRRHRAPDMNEDGIRDSDVAPHDPDEAAWTAPR